jgi:hypothetical protein
MVGELPFSRTSRWSLVPFSLGEKKKEGMREVVEVGVSVAGTGPKRSSWFSAAEKGGERFGEEVAGLAEASFVKRHDGLRKGA